MERTQPEQRDTEAEQTVSLPAMEGAPEPGGQERGRDAEQEDGPGQGGERSWPDWPAFLQSLDDPAQ
jgi:hypothetical protein